MKPYRKQLGLKGLQLIAWLKSETTFPTWQIIVIAMIGGVGGNIVYKILIAIFGPPFGG